MKCVNCGMEMDENAKFCPKCGQKAEPPVAKKTKFKKSFWVKAFIVLIVIGLVMAAQSDSPQKKVEESGNREPSYSAETEKNNASNSKKDQVQVNEQVETKPEKQEDGEKGPEKQTHLVNGMRPEFKEAMDAYEDFYDEYCSFMKKYAEDSSDMTMLMKYYDLIKKAEEMDRKFEAWNDSELNDVELAYYIDVNARIQKMLLQVM